MVNRISSAQIPANSLADIARAQRTLVEAARQSSAQTKATDLKGYGREAQTLISAQRLAGRVKGFIANASELQTRMEVQDTALKRAADMMATLKDELFQNVSLDSGEGVRAQLEEAFAVLKDSMNTSLGGRFLFGGTLNDTAPIKAQSLSQLAADPLTDSIEQGADAQVVRIEDGRTVNAGLVADDVINGAMDCLKRLATLDEGPDGPFRGNLTPNQKAAIQTELGNLTSIYNGLLMAQAENGRMLQDVDSSSARQKAQLETLDDAVGGIVNVDIAEVAVRLNQAQFAYEASASVFNTLRGMTLLNVLK